MRTKTEEKRQEILDIATILFLEKGYDGLSMSEIATEVGGSKATLYGYFPNKDELFLAAMMGHARKISASAFNALDDDTPLPKKLRAFGIAYLNFALSDPMIDLKRAVIAQTAKDDIGKRVYECGLKIGWGRVATVLETHMGPKELIKTEDPWICAMHLKGLLEADLHTRRLLGVDKKINKKIIPDAVDKSLAVFLGFYLKKNQP